MNPIKMNQELLEEVNYLKNQNIFLKKKNKELIKQLRDSGLELQKEKLCLYDKMCVRKRLNDGCPYDCEDDTRK